MKPAVKSDPTESKPVAPPEAQSETSTAVEAPTESEVSAETEAQPKTKASEPSPLAIVSKWNPMNVCLAVTIITAAGMLLSFWSKNPLWILVGLLPVVGYETIRTEEGASTKFSSILLLGLILAEIAMIVFNVHYDLAAFFGETEKYIAGYTLPLGDIKIFAPLLTAILATVLVFRTYGVYTKYLSVVIAIGSLLAVYLVNPLFFQEALKLIINAIFNRLSYAI